MEEGGMMKEDKMMMGGGMMKKEAPKAMMGMVAKAAKSVAGGMMKKDKMMGGGMMKEDKMMENGGMTRKEKREARQANKMAKKAGKKHSRKVRKFVKKNKFTKDEDVQRKMTELHNRQKNTKKKDMYEDGGLRPAPEGNKGKGLRKLPRAVRNKMGYMKKGGMSKYGHGGKMPKKGGVAIMIIANKKSKK